MKFPTLLMSSAIAVALFGCSGNNDTASASATSSPSGAEKCLAKYMEHPCQLLTEDLVKPFSPEGAALTSEEANYAGMSCSISWEGGRTQTFKTAAFSMDAPVNDLAELSQIQPNADREEESIARWFAHRYQQTDEQKAQAAEAAAKRAAESVDEEHAEMAKDFAKSMVSKLKYTQIQGVGDDAAWGGVGKIQALNVRVGRLIFITKLERNDDAAEVQKDSIELAKALIDKCS